MIRLSSQIAFAIFILLASIYGAHRLIHGDFMRTDILSLLPREEREPRHAELKDKAVQALARQVVMLVGHRDRGQALVAAAGLAEALDRRGLGIVRLRFGEEQQRQLAQAYAPYRDRLLSAGDRALLLADRGEDLVRQAEAAIYAPGSLVNSDLLRRDPLLLFARFLEALPRPAGRFAVRDGVLSVSDDDLYYVFLSLQMIASPFQVDVQEAFIDAFAMAAAEIERQCAACVLLKSGAVFYAEAGGRTGTKEISFIGAVSLLGTMALIVLAFRAARPLLLSLGSIAIGLIVAFAVSLWIFGDLHMMTLIFGASLIGVAEDYSVHYFGAGFSAGDRTPLERLAEVLPGSTLGLLTTLTGYLLLALAPLPGFREVAIFSAVGLIAAFLCVLLFFPVFDRRLVPPRPIPFATSLERAIAFWRRGAWGHVQILVLLAMVSAGAAGAVRIQAEDDIRRLQALEPALKAEEQQIERLTGLSRDSRFLLIDAKSTDAALGLSGLLAERLDRLRATGRLAGFQAVAQFVPPFEQQEENRRLVRERLTPAFAQFAADLGLPPDASLGNAMSEPLRPAALRGAHPSLPLLLLDDQGRQQLIIMRGIKDEADIRGAISDLNDVWLVDPAGDVSNLLRDYRLRAMLLIAASIALIYAQLAFRYGLRDAVSVMLAPVLALMLAPLLAALVGEPFTFFSVMALVLVLALGVDYSVFCREAAPGREAATLLAAAIAAASTALSFGLLSFSQIPAVRSFGMVMIFGIAIAILLAPIATRPAGPPR